MSSDLLLSENSVNAKYCSWVIVHEMLLLWILGKRKRTTRRLFFFLIKRYLPDILRFTAIPSAADIKLGGISPGYLIGSAYSSSMLMLKRS